MPLPQSSSSHQSVRLAGPLWAHRISCGSCLSASSALAERRRERAHAAVVPSGTGTGLGGAPGVAGGAVAVPKSRAGVGLRVEVDHRWSRVCPVPRAAGAGLALRCPLCASFPRICRSLRKPTTLKSLDRCQASAVHCPDNLGVEPATMCSSV